MLVIKEVTMATITEDYVSFETAKLLKEKGFNEEDSPFYSEQDRDEWVQNNSYSITNPDYNKDIPFDSETLTMVAPHISLQKAMKWLRVVHNLSIEVYRTACGYVGCIVSIPSGTDIKFLEEDGDDVSSGQYSKWEYACEALIRYCLEHLI